MDITKVNNVLFGSGFISNILDLDIKSTVIDAPEKILEISSIDNFYLFACPVDLNEMGVKLSQTMDHIVFLKKNLDPHTKLIYASSQGVHDLTCENNNQLIYNCYKFAIEHYIKNNFTNFLILRIPRVYGINKTKGLFKAIRDNKIDDYSQIIEYVDEYDFKEWFNKVSSKCGIIEYEGKIIKNDIYNIKKIYNL